MIKWNPSLGKILRIKLFDDKGQEVTFYGIKDFEMDTNPCYPNSLFINFEVEPNDLYTLYTIKPEEN